MSVNVNRNITDSFYRYKMPRIVAKVEGKGNGIKTVIVNMVDVAKALSRPPTYTTKFFGCELGAQTQFDYKNDRFIVNGSHESGKLQDLLDIFIKKFVLCPQCDNPETTLKVQPKKQIIGQSCKACGYAGNLDMRHKLTTFILKNPPDIKPATLGSSLTERKRAKRIKHSKDDPRSGSPRAASDHSDENLENGTSEDQIDHASADDGWTVDVSEEGMKKRMASLTGGVAGLTVTSDLEKSASERAEIFYAFVRKHKESGTLKGNDKAIVSEAERLDIKDKGPLILSELLLDSSIIAQIKTHRLLLLRFCHSNQRAQKYLLGGVEQVIQLHRDLLLPKAPLILKALYDADILEEEVLLDWSKKASKKYVSKELADQIHAKAKPFITWLEEAEDESSDEEDDIEIEYDDRARVESLKDQKHEVVAKPAMLSRTPAAREDEDGDDVDIDAI